MNKIISKIPLIKALKNTDLKKDRGAVFFYCIIFAVSFFVFLKMISPSVQRISLKQFHLENPFPHWVLQQFVPSIYNYANECWLSREPLTEDNLIDARSDGNTTYHYWINHYPLRVLTFHHVRSSMLFKSSYSYAATRSRYRGMTETNFYVLDRQPGKVQINPIKDE